MTQGRSPFFLSLFPSSHLSTIASRRPLLFGMEPPPSSPFPPPHITDCYPSHHRGRRQWTTPDSIDVVREALSHALQPGAMQGHQLHPATRSEPRMMFGRWYRLGSEPKRAAIVALPEGGVATGGWIPDMDPSALNIKRVAVIRRSPSGFRDLIVIDVTPLREGGGAGGGGGAGSGALGGGTAGGAGGEGGGTLITAEATSLDIHVWTVCPCCRRHACCKFVACSICCCGVCPTKDWGQNGNTLDDIAAHVGMTEGVARWTEAPVGTTRDIVGGGAASWPGHPRDNPTPHGGVSAAPVSVDASRQ